MEKLNDISDDTVENKIIVNFTSNVTISGGDGDDTLRNGDGGYGAGGSNVFISAAGGNDYISNSAERAYSSARNLTIDGGDGDDTIDNGPYYYTAGGDSINGGAGNDLIRNRNSNVTVVGGEGNDTIIGNGGEKFIYTSGNDVIEGFRHPYSTLQFMADTDKINKKAQIKGEDIIFAIGEYTLTLSKVLGRNCDASPKNWNILDKDGNKLEFDFIIEGTEENDNLSGVANNISIIGHGGDDTISNSGANVTINAGTGNNKISNSGSNATITSGDGADTIDNSGNNNTINSGAGNDNIQTGSANTTIVSGAGNDFISVRGNSLSIDAGEDNDTIINYYGTNITIKGGKGNDYIEWSGENNSIDAGDDDDTIKGGGNNSTVFGGSGKDSIYNYTYSNVIVLAGDDDDTITSKGFYNTIDGGDGDDLITNGASGHHEGGSTSISGGSGNDSITNDGNNVTIDGGAGNDSINNSTNSYGYGSASSINGGAGDDYIQNNFCSNVTIDGGDGNDTINSTHAVNNSKVIINGGAGDDSIKNATTNSSIDGGDDNDTISNRGKNTTITGGKGNDSILNYNDGYNRENDTILGGAGDDTITNKGVKFVSIDGGDGNDLIILDLYNRNTFSENISLSGGKDNDTVSLDSTTKNILIEYNVGDGNDSIVGFNNTTTLRIEDGDYSTQMSGSDIIVTVGENKITLVGAASLLAVNIIQSLTLTDSSAANITISPGIESVGAVSRTTGINIVGNTLANTIYGGSGNDTISSGGGTDLVFGSVGNDNLNGDADNDTLNGDEGDDILSGGKGDDSLLGGNGNDNLNGNEDNDILLGGAGNDTLTGGGGKDIFVYTSDNDIITDYTPGEDKISLGSAISNAALATVSDSEVLLTVGQNTLTVKNAKNKILTFVDQSGNNWFEKFGDDRTISGSEGDDLINHAAENIKILTGAGNDSIFDTGNNVTIDAGDGNDSIKSGKEYYPNKISLASNNVSVNGGAGSDTINNYASNAIVDGGDDDDRIYNFTENVTIKSGKGNDYVYNNDRNIVRSEYASSVSIYTEEGDDTVENTATSVSVDLGEGNNYFQNRRGGSVTIKGGSSDDTVRNTSSVSYGNKNHAGNNISIDAGDGNNLIENQGHNSTIKSGEGDDTVKNLWFNDANSSGEYSWDCSRGGNRILIEAGGGNNFVANNGNDVTISTNSGNDTIFNGDGRHPVWNTIVDSGNNVLVTSGDGNDSIFNEGSNVTICAGAGNNTITNSGDNLLVKYNNKDNSNNYISGFNKTSTIQISDILHTSSDGKNVFLRIGKNKVTLANATSLETLNVVEQDGNKVELMNTTADKDFILNNSSSVSIDSGAGNDFIRNNKDSDNATISSGKGNDTIVNKGDSVTIFGGEGTDLISLGGSGSNALIVYELNAGNDLIDGFSENSTIQILSGTVNKATSSSKNICLAIGEDTVTLKNAFGLEKLNIIDQNGNKIDITNATDGDDYLYINEPNATISGGKGNNVIHIASHTTVIRHESGNDLIKGFDKTSTLQVQGSVKSAKRNKAGDIFIVDELGEVTLKNAYNSENSPNVIDQDGKTCQLEIGEVNETGTYTNLNDRHRYWTIEGSDGDDTITAPDNADHHNDLDGGRGNDYISNNGTSTTISGGDGNDTIETCPNASNNDIDGGSGDDNFDIHGPNSNVKGGPGDDNIQGGGRGKQFSGDGRGNEYDGGPGNDIMTNGNRDDIGEEIRNKAEKAKDDAEDIYNKANEELIKQFEEAYKDIQKNGENSKYLLGLTKEEIEELLEVYQKISYNMSKYNLTFVEAYTGYVAEHGYKSEIAHLIDRVDKRIDYAKNTKLAEKYGHYADKYGDVTKKMNQRIGKYENYKINAGKLSKGLGLFSTGVELIEFIKANVEYYSNPSYESYDKLMLEGLDVLTSLIPLPPEASNLVSAAVRTAYICSQNSDVDVGKTFKSYINPFNVSDANYVPKSNQLTAFYVEPSQDVAAYSTLQEFYVTSSANVADVQSDVITMRGSTGNDFLQNNFSDRVLIEGDEDNDIVTNYNSSDVTINGGTGKDVIININSPTVTIDGGAGNDSIISNYSANVSINTGEGNNSVSVYDSSNVKISTGDGNNTIDNVGKHVSIQANSGNDSIFNIGAHVSINSGSGNDTITGVGDEVTINSGVGDNVINADGNNISITTGDGNNSITTEENSNILINAGSGADYIVNNSNSSTINAGDGDNIIGNYADNDILINSGSGEDFIENYAEVVTINSGAGEDIVENYSELVTINSNSDIDLVINYGANVKINSGTEDDLIINNGSKVSINGGAGNDFIDNEGLEMTIEGNGGNGSVENFVTDSTTIFGGIGDDTILNKGKNVLFQYNNGDGNDSIVGFNATSTLNISGAEYSSTRSGSDIIITVDNGKITLEGASNLSAVHIDGEEYVEPVWALDGTMAIYGTQKNTLFSLSGVKSTDGISVDHSNKTVTLKNDNLDDKSVSFASNVSGYSFALDGVNTSSSTEAHFDGNTFKSASKTAGYSLASDKKSITYTAAVAESDLFSLSNVKNTESILVDTAKKIVTLNADNLTKAGVTISGDYSLKLDKVAAPVTTPEGWSGLTYKTDYVSAAGYEVKGKSITYTPTTKANDLFALSGLNSTNGVSVTKDGSTYIIKLSDTALNSTTGDTISLNKKSADVSLAFADDFTGNRTETIAKAATLNKGTYTSTAYAKWYELKDSSIAIHPATTAKTFKLNGLSSAAKLGGNVVVTDGDTTAFKFKAAALDKKNITITGGKFSVTLDSDVDTTAEKINESLKLKNGTLSYTAAGTGDFYSANDSGVSYSAQVGGEKFSLSGINNANGVTISNKIVTVDKTALNMTATSAYTVELNGDAYTLNFKANKNSAAIGATLISGTYTSEYTPAYFTGSNKKYTFTTATSPTTFKISGLGSGAKLGENVKVANKVVNISSGALSSKHEKISVSDASYSLQLKDSLVSNIAFKQDGNKVTLSGTTAGYKLVKGSYEWQNKIGGETFTITGLKSGAKLTADMFTRNGNKITFKPKQNLLPDNPTEIKISATNAVIDSSALTTTKAVNAHWEGTSYFGNKTASAWTTNSQTIKYTKVTGGNKIFTLTGVKNTTGISVNTTKKIVTLTAANFDKKTVSIDGNYTLKLANGVPISPTKTAGSFTKFKKGTATYKTASYSDYYTLKNNKITYTAASGGKTFTIKNLKTTTTLDAIKSGITVTEQKDGSCKITFNKADILTTKAPAITATGINYTVAVANALKPSALALDWKVSGTNASLKSDTSAGYSVKDNQIVYSGKVTGSPQVVLSGLIKKASLATPTGKVLSLDAKVLGSNTSLKSNSSGYTVKLTGNMSKKTFTGSDKADTINIAASNAAIIGGGGNDNFTVSGSSVTLTGGKGNDKFSLSGKKPVLIYGAGDGNDTVNFVAGMQISLNGNTSIKTLGKSNSDLLLGFGKNSSIKITGAKSSDTLKVVSGNGSVTLEAGKFDLADSLTFNSKNSSVKVAKNFSGSLAPSDDIYLGGSKLSSVATINASNVTSEITVSGNDKANTISAGKNNDGILGGAGNDSLVGGAGNDKLYGQNGNDSLWGGTGNDTLWGGDGKDVFIYSASKDVIADFTAGQDKIKIASGKISKSSLSGSDVIFTIGKGSLTVKNAKGKSISLIDSTGKVSSTVVGAQTLSNSNKASVSIGSDMSIVDASKRTKAIQITGNDLANSISGGSKNDSIYGGAGNDSVLGNAGNDKLYGQAGNDILKGGKGNDSLWSGKGNDSLWGDDGKDVFIYSAGKDVIFGFENNDLLQITGAFSTSYSKKKGEIYFKVDFTSNAITLKEFTATTFHVNNDKYKISETKLVKK